MSFGDIQITNSSIEKIEVQSVLILATKNLERFFVSFMVQYIYLSIYSFSFKPNFDLNFFLYNVRSMSKINIYHVK